MKELVPGLKLSIEEKVTSDNVATAIGSGALDVYSTPSMIALMEKASMLCVDDCINAEQTTVGGLVNIRHVKATALGRIVFCESKVSAVDGKKIEFEVSAYVDGVLIGSGYHTRFIVNKQKFMNMLK